MLVVEGETRCHGVHKCAIVINIAPHRPTGLMGLLIIWELYGWETKSRYRG